MKFKIGDKVKIKRCYNGIEKKLYLNQEAIIISADDGKYCEYEILFTDLNFKGDKENSYWRENELELVDDNLKHQLTDIAFVIGQLKASNYINLAFKDNEDLYGLCKECQEAYLKQNDFKNRIAYFIRKYLKDKGYWYEIYKQNYVNKDKWRI